MKISTRFLFPAAMLALAATAMPVQAAMAETTGIVVGANIADTAGGEVGTVTRIDGDLVIFKTDKYEVAFPSSSFAKGEKGLIVSMTRDQVNDMVAEAQAKQKAEAEAKLVPGVTVTGSAGGVVGTIESIDSEFVTLKLSSGALVKLPRSGIAAGAEGPVIGMTAAELEAAAKAAASGN